MPIPHRLLFLAAAALLLAGCRRSVPSTQYRTPDVQAEIRVDAWGPEETSVWAFLRPAGEQEEAGLFLTMGKGDELWAEAGGQRLRLETAKEEPSSWIYQGTFAKPVTDGVVRVAFERRDGHPGREKHGGPPPSRRLPFLQPPPGALLAPGVSAGAGGRL